MSDTGSPLHLRYVEPSESFPELDINPAWDAIDTFCGGGPGSGSTTELLALQYLTHADEQPFVKINDAWRKIDSFFSGLSESSDSGERTPFLGLAFLDDGQQQPEVKIDEAFNLINAFAASSDASQSSQSSQGSQSSQSSQSSQASDHSDITVDYDATVLADSPVAYWPLQESTGTAADDLGPHSLTGTYTGAFALAQPPIASGLGASTQFGVGGSGAWVDVPHNSLLDFSSGSYSLELWLELASNGSLQALVCTSITTGSYALIIQSSNKLGIFPASGITSIGTTALATATPYHIVYTYDSVANLSSVYVNGVLDGTAIGGSPGPGGSSDFNIGSVAGGGPTLGNISNVAVYDSALSPTRIAAHYAAGI